jgi:hypothetical protein
VIAEMALRLDLTGFRSHAGAQACLDVQGRCYYATVYADEKTIPWSNLEKEFKRLFSYTPPMRLTLSDIETSCALAAVVPASEVKDITLKIKR